MQNKANWHPHLESRIGLGCVTFGREIDSETSFDVLDFALQQGITFLDTAEAYGKGMSETVLGNWLTARNCRDRIVLQTKVSFDFSPDGIRQALAASLDRLQQPSVDLFVLHSFNPKFPLAPSLEALTQAVQDGKTRAVGCSNFTFDQLREANQLCAQNGFVPLTALQPPYSLAAREIEGPYLEYCASNGVFVNSYSPLAAGFLTGKYAPGQPVPPGSRFDVIPGHQSIYFNEQNFQLVERLRNLSERTGHTMARLAMAWAFQNQRINCILAGARSIEQVQNAIAASTLPFEPEWNQFLLG